MFGRTPTTISFKCAIAQRYESDISLPRATRNIVRVHSFLGANIIRWISAAMFSVVTVLGSTYHDIIVVARKRNNKPSNGVWNCGHSGRDWMQLQTRQFYQPVSSHAHTTLASLWLRHLLRRPSTEKNLLLLIRISWSNKSSLSTRLIDYHLRLLGFTI